MNNFLKRHALPNELQPIEDFTSKLKTYNNNSQLTSADQADLHKELHRHVEKAKAGIKHAMVRFKKAHHSRAYIQLHQEALLDLGGQLLPYMHPIHLNAQQPPPEGVVLQAKLIFQAIEELLRFLETYFPVYIDVDSWVPTRYMGAVYHDISASVGTWQALLNQLGVDPKLLGIVVLPFNRFLADPEKYGRYRKISYLRRLDDELYYLSRQCTPASIDASLRTLLLTINFNLEEFVTYCTDYQEKLLAEVEDSEEEQMQVLARFRKYLSRIVPKPQFKFDNDRPYLLEELTAWIGTGVEYIESTCQIHKADDTETTSSQWTINKIEFDLTTEQLFYLFRVLLAIKLIQHAKPGKLTEFITRFFRTNRTGDIGGRNVRKKLYSVKDEVRRAVREWFVKAIKFIDQDNGESDTW